MFAALSLLAVGLLALSPSAYLPPVMQIASAACLLYTSDAADEL